MAQPAIALRARARTILIVLFVLFVLFVMFVMHVMHVMIVMGTQGIIGGVMGLPSNLESGISSPVVADRRRPVAVDIIAAFPTLVDFPNENTISAACYVDSAP
jgi:hypothetical protein